MERFSVRGAVRNEASYTQLKDYSQLRYGLITPSDIDGFIDFQNRAFVFIEVKYGTAEMNVGQRLAYERLCDACRKSGIPSIVVVAHHNMPPAEMIPVHNVPVTKIRWGDRWHSQSGTRTVKEIVDLFYDRYVVGNHGRA